MCSSRSRSSSFGIEKLRLREHLPSEIRTEETRRIEVDPSAENLAQLVLHREERQARRVSWLEFDEDVDVALGPKLRSQDRSEESEPADVVRLAKPCDPRPIDGNCDWHERVSRRTKSVQSHDNVTEMVLIVSRLDR